MVGDRLHGSGVRKRASSSQAISHNELAFISERNVTFASSNRAPREYEL